MILIILIVVVSNFLFLLNFDLISKKLNIYDIPGSRKIHTKKISRIGGFLLLSTHLIYYIYFYHFYDNDLDFYHNLSLNLFLLPITFFLIGIFDDKYNLNANLKLFSLGIILLIFLPNFDDFIIKEIKVSFLDKKLLLNEYGLIFTILCILLFVNATNMIDGLDGLCSIYCLVIFINIFFVFERNLYISLISLSLFFFIYLNLKKKCFLGDGGNFFLSIIISLIFLRLYNTKSIEFSDEIYLYMSIPGLDMLRVFFIRLSRGISPFLPDKNHLHHLILSKLKSEKLTLIFCLILFFLPLIIYKITLNLVISNTVGLVLYITTIIVFYGHTSKNLK